MSTFYEYIKKYKFIFAVAIVCLSLESLCDLMQPTIMAKIIDIGVKEKNSAYVLAGGLRMLLITALGAGFASVRAIIASHVSQRIGLELRFELFKKIQEFAFANKDSFGEASLITRLTNDVTQVQNFMNGLMRVFVRAPMLCIGSMIMAVSLNPKMSVVFLVMVPVIVCLTILNLKVGYPYFTKIQKALDEVNTVMREYLGGIRVVKAFNRFRYEVTRFEKRNDYLGEMNMKAAKAMAVFAPALHFTVNMSIVTILWLSGSSIQTGSIKVGEVMAFINYMTQILFALNMINHVFMNFIRAKASSERIQEVLKREDEKTLYQLTEEGTEAFNTTSKKGEVSFLNVSFSYNSLENTVLKNISFHCKKGETIGIIGATGAGKSTLVNLIPGFYYPLSGKVELNGIDIKTINPQYVREKIAIVPQKTLLFTGSIEGNIKWGKEDADREEVERAAAIAQAHAFIQEFPEGYDTLLGQGGINLSGGQKQRIALARALIKKPEILILDDCTSAVDLRTETKMREALRKYMKGMTAFIITQRIRSIKDADRIIVLENGKVAGIGKHEELIRDCKVYGEIVSSQFGKEER